LEKNDSKQFSYISELIPEENIDLWSPGDRILITAQTGSGKSEFIKGRLYNYCLKNNKKILLLSNRILLREQIKEDLSEENKHKIVKVINYQFFEKMVLGGNQVQELFSAYDYIVYDEVHYIFSDSQFNRNTDLLIDPIKNGFKNKIFIFLTATPQALLDYHSAYSHQYHLPFNYNYIKNIYTFTSEEIAESILQNIPSDEKAIYFSSNALTALDLSKKFSDAAFFCSDSNQLSDFSNSAVLSQISQNSKFNNRFLFTTKVLDNGVNIKDSKVKHILIDMPDVISFIQCLGRKRILDKEDYINLYIKDYHDGNLKYMLRGYLEKVRFVKEFKQISEDEFKEKYRKKDFDDVIDNDFRINLAKYQNYMTQSRLLRQMLWENKEKRGSYIHFICKILKYDYKKIKNGNKVFEKISIEDLLQKYVGIKMFKDEQERFKILFFDKIFSPKKTNYRHRGIRSINAILQEDNLPYVLSSRKEKKRSSNRDKYYWLVSSTENFPSSPNPTQ